MKILKAKDGGKSTARMVIVDDHGQPPASAFGQRSERPKLDKATTFRVGDLVTRDGTDLQRVIEANGDLITVECVKEPLGWLQEDGVTRDEPWCKVGDREENLARRYEHAGPIIESGQGVDSPAAIT